MKKLLLLSFALGLGSIAQAQTNVYSFGFDTDIPTTWETTNQSSPAGTVKWGKAPYTTTSTATSSIFGSGIGNIPNGQSGGANSFAIVNFNSVAAGQAGTISNWLITQAIDVKDGDVVSFYTRKGTDGTGDWADRLEVRYSIGATSTAPSGATGVGSFTNLGVTVNPNLEKGFVYPKTWTKYQFTVSGVGTTSAAVKFAFRYFVTDGGPEGTNSDIIGIDTFSIDRAALGVNETASGSKISVYPNPATDVLNVNGVSGIKNIEVFDISGRKVDVKVKDNTVSVQNLKSGAYIINVEAKEGKITEKFIKK